MTAQNESLTAMQRERRRLAQVRKSFGAGVDLQAKGTGVSIEFFGACIDYIKASMDRLHAQDQRIHDLLAPHAVAQTPDAKAILAHLDLRLGKSREALGKLVAARDAYRAQGEKGWPVFKAAVDQFMDIYLNVLMSGQHSTLDMQKQVFTDADNHAVAAHSADSYQIEATLFAGVKRLAPAGTDPESFPSARPGA